MKNHQKVLPSFEPGPLFEFIDKQSLEVGFDSVSFFNCSTAEFFFSGVDSMNQSNQCNCCNRYPSG